MLIDSHVHLGAYQRYGPVRLKTIDDILREMEKYGIEKAAISHLISIQHDVSEGNALLAEAQRQHPDEIIPYCCVNPQNYSQARDELMRYVDDLGWRGVKLHPQYHEYRPESAACLRVLEMIAERKEVFVLFHSGDGYVGSLCSPTSIGAVASRFPNTMIIMGHMGVSDWPEAIAVALQHPNIVLDTTGATSSYGMLEFAVQALGADRIIWGSDMPLYPVYHGLAKVAQSELAEEDKAKILGDNYFRMFLAPSAPPKGGYTT